MSMKSMMMMPPEVAQADLADDLGGRLEVDLQHRLLEVALADVLAGVDVDRDQRLGVVDDDVAAGLEPHPAPERLVDVLLDAGRLEDRRGSSYSLTRGGELRHQRLGEVQALVVGGRGLSTRNSSTSGEKRSRTTRKVRSISSCRSDGACADSKRPAPAPTAASGTRCRRSAPRSPLPSATVRTMNPPGGGGRPLTRPPAGGRARASSLDAARDADVPGLRHVDDVAAGDGDERGDRGRPWCRATPWRPGRAPPGPCAASPRWAPTASRRGSGSPSPSPSPASAIGAPHRRRARRRG